MADDGTTTPAPDRSSRSVIRHGRYTSYTNLACRCQDCREAHTVKTRAVRAAQVALAPDDPRHGRVSTYLNYGCRCRLCTEAKRASKIAEWARRKEAASETRRC